MVMITMINHYILNFISIAHDFVGWVYYCVVHTSLDFYLVQPYHYVLISKNHHNVAKTDSDSNDNDSNSNDDDNNSNDDDDKIIIVIILE
jgi:hypothetical protein